MRRFSYFHLFSFLLSVFGTEDFKQEQECDDNFECTDRERCDWYQNKLLEIKSSNDSRLKSEIFQYLRSLVCNRKLKKICCPMRYELKIFKCD